MKKRVTLILPEELYETLREQSKEDCRTLPNYIRWILRRYLQAQEQQKPDVCS